MSTQTLVITGMHRSGTSLAADVMQRAGVHIGDRLLGPAAGNPRGHFEDVEFYALHERCLARHGLDFLLESADGLGEFDADEKAEAGRLIRARQSHGLWGWKDPRTALFLEEWDRLLPEARYVLIFRHPVEVVLSLLRRSSDLQIAADPLHGLRTWEVYNRAILAFARAHRERCMVVSSSAIVADPDAWVRAVERRLGPTLGTVSMNGAVSADLRRIELSVEARARFAEIAPSAASVFAALSGEAEPWLAGAHTGVPLDPGVERPPAREAGRAFACLLATLDPAAVLASRDALDVFHRAAISASEDAVRWYRAEIERVRADAEGRVNAERRIEELVERARSLEEALAQRTGELERSEQQCAALEASLLNRLVRRWRRLSAGSARGRRTGRIAGGVSPIARARPASPHGVVVFVSHDAHRHGAQLLLLQLLRWIRANTDLAFEVVLKGDGELRTDFEAVAPTHRWPAALHTSEALREPSRIGLIYCNTITNGDLLAGLPQVSCPVVTHVHELEHWIHHHVDPEHLRHVVERTSHYVAVSERVRRALIESLRVPPERIDLVYEFVGPEALGPPDPEAARRLRRVLGIPDEARIVGGSGTMDWRKGPDLFVQAAAAVRRIEASPVHFVWVGGARAGQAYEKLRHDARHAGVADVMHFVGAVTDPMAYFGIFDVFALTSREDPFPLVALEAAAHAVPIVCFEQAGGAVELVRDGCGTSVPYLRVEALAERVAELLRDPDRRRTLGTRGATVVRERYTVDVIAPAIVALVQRLLSEPAKRIMAH